MATSDEEGNSKRQCQAVGCRVNLAALGKPYCLMRRICPEHMKADVVQCGGANAGAYRYCQQCGRLEPLCMFDGLKRSCRLSLQFRRSRTHDPPGEYPAARAAAAADPRTGQPPKRRRRKRQAAFAAAAAAAVAAAAAADGVALDAGSDHVASNYAATLLPMDATACGALPASQLVTVPEAASYPGSLPRHAGMSLAAGWQL